jgi:hypothetical protein
VPAEMAKNGLVRGENGLEVHVMCEIPSNVILADDFCDIFDGFPSVPTASRNSCGARTAIRGWWQVCWTNGTRPSAR